MVKRHLTTIPINRFKLDKKYPTGTTVAEEVGGKIFVQGSKPDVLVDETTRQFIEDPNHLFNLTLRNYPSQ